MKTTKFYICDSSQNSGKPYLCANTYENSGVKDGSLCFETKKEAEKFISQNGWDWAFIEED